MIKKNLPCVAHEKFSTKNSVLSTQCGRKFQPKSIIFLYLLGFYSYLFFNIGYKSHQNHLLSTYSHYNKTIALILRSSFTPRIKCLIVFLFILFRFYNSQGFLFCKIFLLFILHDLCLFWL